jgi:hypothetical protein
MDIADVHAAVVPEIHQRVALVFEGYPMAGMGETFEELSVLFEALGLCHLLEAVDLRAFAENLCRSGHARRYFLRRSRAEGNVDDPRLALGRTSAVLDALAAGDVGLAGDIAALSITEWQPDWEYEDDFCYFLFLHRVILGQGGDLVVPNATLVAILDRFERALEGASSPRLGVCRALVARDAAAFADALARRLDQIAGEHDVERTTAAVQEDIDVGFWPRSFVSIEGLALLNLGGLLGVRVAGDPRMCPQVARLPIQPNDYRDIFDEIVAP